jgi:SulP family sulfate permease
MSNKTRFHTVTGDISGALTAAIITLPMSIAYGIIAFAPLGAEFVPMAALAGVYAAVFAGFFASLTGGSPIQITGPMITLTLVLSTFVSSLVSNPIIGPSPTIILGLTSLCVLLAGCAQVVAGLLGLSNLVKYVPQPVFAGFINGIALLVVLGQIYPILGVDGNTSLFDILRHPEAINPITAVTGLITIVSIYISKRYVKGIPPTVTALVAGIGAYYFLTTLFPVARSGQLIGSLQSSLPKPYIFFHLYEKMTTFPILSILPQLFVTSLVISFVGAMESLLSAVVSDNLLKRQHNSKREIVGLGIGNIAGSLFGAIASAGSIIRSTANFKAGGRTRLSGMLCSVFILLMILLLGSYAGKIPIAVFAGIIFVVGVNLFDKWTLKILRKFFTSYTYPKEAKLDIFIIIFVAVTTVSINLISAVLVGMIVAAILFISKIGRSVVRRHYFADNFRSRKMRPTAHIKELETKGRQISILQLQGPIFFGSAENLAEEIQRIAHHSNYIILDFKRVTEIDSTGSSILLRVDQTIAKEKKHILFSNLYNNKMVWPFLVMLNFTDSLIGEHLFSYTDSALEWAEERILDKDQHQEGCLQEFDIHKASLFDGFTEDEMEMIQEKLVHESYSKGDFVFSENDSSRDLYILIKGLMTVKIYLPERDRYKRLFTYSPGVVFGEMSFLDGSPRSAGVRAYEDSEVYCLAYEEFEILCEQYSDISNKLLKNIALEISHRLRRTSNQVRELEEN